MPLCLLLGQRCAARNVQFSVVEPQGFQVDGRIVATNLTPHPKATEVEWGGRWIPVSVNGISTRVIPAP